jgi:hypothetical protein
MVGFNRVAVANLARLIFQLRTDCPPNLRRPYSPCSLPSFVGSLGRLGQRFEVKNGERQDQSGCRLQKKCAGNVALDAKKHSAIQSGLVRFTV